MANLLDTNKQLVRDFYDIAFNQQKPAAAAERYLGRTYRQHNPGAGDGVAPFVAFVTSFVTAEDLKGMFVFAPDTRIKEHPIKIASGEWTAVTGVMEGTFSQPMPIGEGKTTPPTGKPFRLPMVTIGHWKDGVMDEEWLMWDNQAFMKQIGLAP